MCIREKTTIYLVGGMTFFFLRKNFLHPSSGNRSFLEIWSLPFSSFSTTLIMLRFIHSFIHSLYISIMVIRVHQYEASTLFKSYGWAVWKKVAVAGPKFSYSFSHKLLTSRHLTSHSSLPRSLERWGIN